MSAARAGEVLDLLAGAATLVRRSSTLDGSLPLRAARACEPVLAGNRLGWQVSLTAGVVARRRLGRWQIEWRGDGEALRRRHAAVIPVALRRGLLAEGSRWLRRLAERPAWSEGDALWVWTGLLVRAAAGTWLRVAPPGNRRALGYTCKETWIAPSDAPVPLVLRLVPHAAELEIHGEVATLAAFAPELEVEAARLVDAPALARRHLEFYDAEYFTGKRARSTMKYRAWARAAAATEGDPRRATLAAAGPVEWELVGLGERVDAPAGPDLAAPSAARVAAVQVRSGLEFTARFDGLHVETGCDPDELAARARAIEAAWDGLGPAVRERLAAHRGALWYFSKYFTPHVVGEPHFFVKPCALLRTPPGVACVVEGSCGPAWDVMRGVIATDRVHVLPAVFKIHAAGAFTVPRGAPLLQAIPTPAATLAATLDHTDVTW